MSVILTGDQMRSVLGRIAEIERQMLQKSGYPFDPVKLEEHLQAAIEGRFMKNPVAVPEGLDPMVYVDRSTKLAYSPNNDVEVLYPELENTGPAEYDGTKLRQFLLPDQVRDIVTGYQIHEYLKHNNMLESCLGLRDLLAIKKKGIAFFRANFEDKVVFGWRSVVRYHDGFLRVPGLLGGDDLLLLRWHRLDYGFDTASTALRFAA